MRGFTVYRVKGPGKRKKFSIPIGQDKSYTGPVSNNLLPISCIILDHYLFDCLAANFIDMLMIS